MQKPPLHHPCAASLRCHLPPHLTPPCTAAPPPSSTVPLPHLSSLPTRSSPQVVSREATPGDDPNPRIRQLIFISPAAAAVGVGGGGRTRLPKAGGGGGAPMYPPSHGGGVFQGRRRWTAGLVVVAFGYITMDMAGDEGVWRHAAGKGRQRPSPSLLDLHRPGWRRKMDRGSQSWRRCGRRPFRLSWW
ncbi:hypothetical protein QYE76_067507 [Lolium multiflorum]|uniref:Uncharacterized protein n=1 Tax=Lolium multiflorum TaxID=4521 RepID=A0AAD8SCQ8_LOLMU|nr:hypothetical protein QYE76_067507 [Lolium multiflorum]